MRTRTAFLVVAALFAAFFSPQLYAQADASTDLSQSKAAKQAFAEEKKAEDQVESLNNQLNAPPPDFWGLSSMEAAQQAIQAHQDNADELQRQLAIAEKRLAAARENARPFHLERIRLQNKEDNRQANPSSQTDDPVGALMQSARRITDQTVTETAAAVKDPEPEKFGGPPTETIVRIITSDGASVNGNPQELANTMMFALMQKMMQKTPLIKEIKRGKPLTSLISAQIPTGTEVFPIRVLIADALGPTHNMDFYFYKNEFDDWAAVSKPD